MARAGSEVVQWQGLGEADPLPLRGRGVADRDLPDLTPLGCEQLDGARRPPHADAREPHWVLEVDPERHTHEAEVVPEPLGVHDAAPFGPRHPNSAPAARTRMTRPASMASRGQTQRR